MASKKPTAAQIRARLANPGERARLDVKYLTPKQRQQRELNARLAAPVTPGSSLTNRDLAHQAANAVQIEYGPQEQQLAANLAARRQTEQDAAGWFQAYQNDLAQHAANVQAINTAQQQALDATVKAAAGSLAPGGTATPDDANAAKIRATLAGIGSTVGGSVGQSNQTYADTQARVVAPGQRLVGMLGLRKDTQSVRDKISALKQQEGSYNSKFRADTVGNEAKNVLAQQALTGKNAEQQTRDQLTAGAAGGKYGYTPQEWLALTPAERTKIVADNRTRPKGSDMGRINSYGYTESDWRRMSTAQRQKVIKDFKRTGGSQRQKAPVAGPGSISSSAESKYISQINKVYAYLDDPSSYQISSVDPQTGIKTSRPAKNAKEVLQAIKAQGVDPRVVKVARSLFHNHGTGLGKWGVDNAHDLGIHVSPHWKVIRS